HLPRGRGPESAADSTVPGCGSQGLDYFTSAIPTLFTPLQARLRLPSLVATMFLTTPPPEGMGVLLKNFLVLGSNDTSVLGETPDSLYQTMPSPVMAMP